MKLTKQAVLNLIKSVNLTPQQRKVVFVKVARMLEPKTVINLIKKADQPGPFRTLLQGSLEGLDAADRALGRGSRAVGDAVGSSPVTQDIMTDFGRTADQFRNIPSDARDTLSGIHAGLTNAGEDAYRVYRDLTLRPAYMDRRRPQGPAYDRTQREWERQQHDQNVLAPNLQDPALARDYQAFANRAMQSGQVDPREINRQWQQHHHRRQREHTQYRDMLASMDATTEDQFRNFMQDRASIARTRAERGDPNEYMNIMRQARNDAMDVWSQQQQQQLASRVEPGSNVNLSGPSSFFDRGRQIGATAPRTAAPTSSPTPQMPAPTRSPSRAISSPPAIRSGIIPAPEQSQLAGPTLQPNVSPLRRLN